MKIRYALITALIVTALLPAQQADSATARDAPQNPVALNAQEEDNELDVTADRMEILLDGKTIELTDNVRFEDQTMILTASRMKIFLQEGENQDGNTQNADPEHSDMRLKRIEADGNVVLRKKIDATESVMGDKAVYEVKTDTVTLSGNCVVTQGGHVMKGRLVTFNRLQQKIQVKQAVITIKLPKGKGKNRGFGGLIAPTPEKD